MNIPEIDKEIESALSRYPSIKINSENESNLQKIHSIFSQLSYLISSSVDEREVNEFKKVLTKITLIIASNPEYLTVFNNSLQETQQELQSLSKTPPNSEEKKNSKKISIDPIVTHERIEYLMRALGHTGHLPGVCGGIGKTSFKYIIFRKLIQFDSQVKKLEILFKKLKEEGREIDSITKEEIRECCDRIGPDFYATIQNFLSKVDVVFNARKYPDLFVEAPKIADAGRQSKTSFIQNTGLDKSIKKLGGFVNAYTKDELVELLINLKQFTLKNESKTTFAFRLSTLEHELTISYDSINKTWIFIDANKLWIRGVESEEKLADELIDSFFKRNNPLSVIIYGAELPSPDISAQIREMYKISSKTTSFLSEHQVSCLFIAARDDLEDNVDSLLKCGADKNKPGPDGISPLYEACQKGNYNAVNALLNYVTDVNQAGYFGSTPLCTACQNRHASIVELLLSRNAEIDKARKDGQTPLMIAASSNQLFILNLLLTKGADINKFDNNGQSALLLATIDKNKDIIRLLVSKKADVNKSRMDGCSPLLAAIDNRDKDIVKFLLEHGANINQPAKNGVTPLSLAIHHNLKDIVELLLTTQHPRKNEMTPLLIATERKDKKTINFLLDHGANINEPGKNRATPLLLAAQLGRADIVELLLNRRADVNLSGGDKVTPLYSASRNGDLATVKLLLINGANVNKLAINGLSPLHTACKHGHFAVIQELLAHRAHINQKREDDGMTPLLIAVQIGRKDIVDLLLCNGADVNEANKKKASALSIAAANNYFDIIKSIATHLKNKRKALD